MRCDISGGLVLLFTYLLNFINALATEAAEDSCRAGVPTSCTGRYTRCSCLHEQAKIHRARLSVMQAINSKWMKY